MKNAKKSEKRSETCPKNVLAPFCRKRADYGFEEYGFRHQAQWAFWGSLSSGKRTQWVPLSLLFVCQSELIEFFAELTEFVPKLSEAQWVLFSKTVLSKEYSACFLCWLLKLSKTKTPQTVTLQVTILRQQISKKTARAWALFCFNFALKLCDNLLAEKSDKIATRSVTVCSVLVLPSVSPALPKIASPPTISEKKSPRRSAGVATLTSSPANRLQGGLPRHWEGVGLRCTRCTWANPDEDAPSVQQQKNKRAKTKSKKKSPIPCVQMALQTEKIYFQNNLAFHSRYRDRPKMFRIYFFLVADARDSCSSQLRGRAA